MLELRTTNEIKATRSRVWGYAALFDAPTDLGEFREVVRKGAFRRSLVESSIRALYDHDSAKLLGTTRAGTLSLREDDKGLAFELDLPDTTHGRDVAELIRRGDIAGCSFGFTTRSDKWIAGDKFTRELLDVDLAEITLTANPAYPQTTVALRSLDAMVKQSGDACLRKLWMETL